MRDLWRCRGRAPLRLLLSLGLLLTLQMNVDVFALRAEALSSLRSLSPEIKDAAPPVFCLDVGIEIAFPSRDVENAMGGETETSAGRGCLRSSPMIAVVSHLKASLRTFSLHAVDCVLEPVDVESSTIALLGVVSVCSRTNMDMEEQMATWGREVKRQVGSLFENEKRVSFDQTTGMVGHVPVSPPYELPSSGSGLPQFILGETLIWSDGEDEAEQEKDPTTKDQTFFTHVQMAVKNDGKTPLHLYRLTLVERMETRGMDDKTVGFVLTLVAPAVVQPGKSEIVSFKAITGAVVDSSKSYVLYISHSGFRSHVFEGVLDGKKFLSREEAVQPQGDDGLFDRFTLDSATTQSLLSSFPYATWQVGSIAIAVAVGLVVTLYIRRKRLSVRLMGHVVTSCFRSSGKKSPHTSGGRTSAKPMSNRVTSSRAAISKRGEDHIEMESLIKKPTITNSTSRNSSNSGKPAFHPKMPAITMKWKAPPPPPPRAAAPVTKTAPLTAPKAIVLKKLSLDLDRGARLHPKRFESMWDEYVERFQNVLSGTKRPDSDTLLKKMESHGISCMASGTVNGVEKYVFYAKQRDKSWFFLATVDVTVATANTILIVRASSEAADELVAQLVELVKTTMTESVVS